MASLKPRTFKSTFEEVGLFGQHISNDQIKHEPMLFNANPEFAYNNGGPITKAFLEALPYDWIDYVFDSRVHMLMPGWYPCIPGWHHDDVPRNTQDGQPDYENPKYHSEHILGLVNASVCPTLLLKDHVSVKAVAPGNVIYKQWSDEIESQIAKGQFSPIAAKDRTLYRFDWQTFHTGTQAVENGWRWFGRVSRKTDRLNSVTNEIRRNAQVYLEIPTMGW